MTNGGEEKKKDRTILSSLIPAPVHTALWGHRLGSACGVVQQGCAQGQGSACCWAGYVWASHIWQPRARLFVAVVMMELRSDRSLHLSPCWLVACCGPQVKDVTEPSPLRWMLGFAPAASPLELAPARRCPPVPKLRTTLLSLHFPPLPFSPSYHPKPTSKCWVPARLLLWMDRAEVFFPPPHSGFPNYPILLLQRAPLLGARH